MNNSYLPSPLASHNPGVHHESALGHAQLPKGQMHAPGLRGNKNSSRVESATGLPQPKLLSIVDEEDTIVTEEKFTETQGENEDKESGTHASGRMERAVARSHGKRDPFANENSSEVQYKTMAWWYVRPAKILQASDIP